ncbi:uncharacterized protein LOC126470937 [Schistocerca serialis cubense]|uniref:uncharacterized protein LOC126470937 n=1 Tax=Schistocerca serialis cubense TaxID=2023355 RepID=UPI00214F2DF5|nr:uncharacterized protein LOC126470937 [Schistocerca serialis cubense]
MEDQRFIAFLLSLAVLATAVINSGSVTAHSTSGVETTGVEGKNANAYDEGARDDLWPENSTQPNSDEVSLKESGDSIDDVPTGLNEGNSVNVTVEEPDINGTTTEATMDLDQLEQEIHDLNMKVLQYTDWSANDKNNYLEERPQTGL